MLYHLVLFGTFWFWLIVVLELGILLYCAAWELSAARSLVPTLFFIAALQLFSDVNILGFVWNNPLTILLGLFIYLLGGCLWVFPKWWLFCKENLRNYCEIRDEWLCTQGLPSGVVPEESKNLWKEYYKNKVAYQTRANTYQWSDGGFYFGIKLDPAKYKDLIVSWMILWPLSLLCTIFNDPVVRFFRHVYHEITGILRRISDNVFKNVNNDL